MKGLWNSAKWELRESGLLRGQTLFFLGLWLIYDLKAAISWNGNGLPLLFSFHLITAAVLAVYRGLKWPFTGSFDPTQPDRAGSSASRHRARQNSFFFIIKLLLRGICFSKTGRCFLRIQLFVGDEQLPPVGDSQLAVDIFAVEVDGGR